jgi:glycosyltransferase involved in cell wall biosynthesis
MHLGVEATKMAGDGRGIGRYVRQLLRQFARLRPDLRVTLYTDGPAAADARLRAELLAMGYGPDRGGVAKVRGLRSAPPELAWYPWNKTKHFSRSPWMAVTIHDLAPFHFQYRSWLKRGLQRHIEKRFRETAARADLILTPSACSRADIISILGMPASKVTVTPLAADDFRPASGPPDYTGLATRFGIPRNYFLYVGVNEERKNLARLREAFRQVHSGSGPQTALVICGSAAPPGPPEPGVHWVGRVSEAELRALYHAALAFVLPSLFEGFGLPLLEAMASGTPVLCSRAASLPEVAGEAALYFDPLDVAALADVMTRCLTDEALRLDLARRGLAQARTFRWEETAQRTLAAFDDLLGGRPTPRS